MDLPILLAERGLVPDAWVRAGIRSLLRKRLAAERTLHAADPGQRWREVVRGGPIAFATREANEQHYEVPAAFFELALGPRLKYSSAWWDASTPDLAAAEDAMLALTAERAGLADGQRILELGCGWGSLTLWMAERFPRARIVAVSNSASQRRFILARAAAGKLDNLEVLTQDVAAFEPTGAFDRVVSVEMFEHLRNWETMLQRVRRWLAPGGRLFLHVFAHRDYCYPFETSAGDDWMGRHFFTGGMMPAVGMLDALETPFQVERSWIVSGEHYARTAEAWLANLDRSRAAARAVLGEAGADGALAVRRWRLFFLACAETFAYRAGAEWVVWHARLAPEDDPA
jgi:cyclopropane-fatty-acyl-phospholipid synthase